MRIIRLYQLPDKTIWGSFGEWWNTIRSGEKYKYLVFSEDRTIKAFEEVARLKQLCKTMFGFSALQYLRNIFWLLSALLLLAWPITGMYLEDTVRLVLFCIIGVGFSWTIYNFLNTLLNMRWLENREDQVAEFEYKKKRIPPPVVGWRTEEPKKPSLSWSRRIFVLMLVLNCFILATPQYPAVMDNRVIEELTLTYPGSQWEIKPRVFEDSVIAYYSYDEDSSTLWVVRLSYIIKLDDLTINSDTFRAWIQNVHSSYLSNITTQVRASMPNVDEEEFRQSFDEEVWPEIVENYRSSLVWYVEEAYPGLRIMPAITLEKMSVKEYQKEVQR